MLIVRLFFWSVAVCLLAAVVHIVAILALPAFAPKSATASAYSMLKANTLARFTPAPDQSGVFARENPDMEILVCRYDARRAPVRLTGPVTGEYWSITVYDSKGRNRFALNDSYQVFEKIDLIIDTRKRDIEASEKTLIIQDTSATGLVVLRAFRPFRAYAQSLRASLGEFVCAEMSH